jgi:carboxypeptidase T
MNRNRSCLFVALAFVLVSPLALQAAPSQADPEHHSLVQLYLDSPAGTQFLQTNRGRLDVLLVKPGILAQIAAQPADLELLNRSGLRYEILEADMEMAYAGPEKAAGFGLFHTYSENVAFVDSLRLLYPEVISEKWSIGQSHEGNDLWCFRVSDNPDLDESEPEILIDGMHHAREIMASEFPIMFAEYLAQNYGTDPEITWLLDNRELYIVPIVNPDGVIYNESTDPAGGGMWRKNRRDNGDGTIGVDPNRNYPYEWGYDDTGSSPDSDSIVYRGPSAGSEPEVQAMMNLVNSRQFITHDTVHTYSNLTLYPFGFNTVPAPDAAAFTLMGAEMCKFNGYVYGTPVEAINYAVNGGTFDWTYGQKGVFSFSNEIGGSSDGFWPDESRRGALFQENIWPHLYLMRAAGPYIAVHSGSALPVAKAIGPGQSGLLDFTVENQGATAASLPVDLTIASNDAWLQLDEGQRSIVSLPALSGTNLGSSSIPFSVEAGCPEGHFAVVDVTAHMPEGDQTYSLPLLVGTPGPVLADDLESGDGNWTVTGSWSLSSEDAHSGSYCLTDSPGATYGDEQSTTATLGGSFLATRISFWQKYSIEEGYDYGRLQVAVDGGAWTNLYGCTGLQSTWEFVELDLAQYLGQELQFRFMMESDVSVIDDGWWLDDITIEGVNRDNLPPSTPGLLVPVGKNAALVQHTVGVWNSTDPEGAPLTYGFRFYSDELCTQPLFEVTDVPEGDPYTEYAATGLVEDVYYWWRAWAFDGVERSLLTQPQSFLAGQPSGVGDQIVTGPGLRILTGVTGRDARLQLNLPQSGRVSVDVYNARGARIRQLHAGSMESGSPILIWDGRDGSGRNVSSGVYLVRMQYAGENFTGRVVVVR